MKRHVKWLIPLLLIPVLFYGGMYSSSALSTASEAADNPGLALAAVGLFLVGLIGPVVAVVAAIVAGVRTYRQWRRSNGHFSPSERAVNAVRGQREHSSTAAWSQAQALRASLIAREVPPAIRVWEVVPNAGEVMFFDLSADYARYYGRDVQYSQSGGFFFGHPAFVLAGLAATGIGNTRRRNAAIAASQATWRESQPARVVVTNQRLVCHAGGQWLSFPYSTMTAVYPEVDRWTLICEFGGTAEPLLLAGPDAALISVMTVLLTHGADAVAEHPSLQRLG
ncbi:hypothetical protein [Cryobacterium sp. W22_MBD10_FK3]|uniref:hypothetical protein n=1 Tax=Cryobacterium sp. W22_MBD10_FK3 TaxID=3240273 RepID=UPI003F8F3CFF